jgi:hypothetical protein
VELTFILLPSGINPALVGIKDLICDAWEAPADHVLVRTATAKPPMKRGLWSNNRDVGTTGGPRKRIEEQSDADVLASLWPDWKYAPVVAVPQLFIEVYLPHLRLAEVKLFLYFCSHIPVPSPSTTPASISVTVKEMAASVGLSRDMAMKALQVLEREKLIVCDRPRGRSANQYRICWATFRWRPPR